MAASFLIIKFMKNATEETKMPSKQGLPIQIRHEENPILDITDKGSLHSIKCYINTYTEEMINRSNRGKEAKMAKPSNWLSKDTV